MPSPQQTKQITLYTATWSPFSQRVRIALEEAGAKYKICQVDILLNKPDWFKLVNPLETIPALTYGGPEVPPYEPSAQSAKLVESLAILEFIAEVYPQAKLLPADPILRARARAYMAVYENNVYPLFRAVWFLGHPAEPLLKALDTLQGMLPPTGYVIGEWSIADAAVTPFLARMGPYLEAGLGLYTAADRAKMTDALGSERFARLSQYVQDVRARPSFEVTWAGDAVQIEVAKSSIPMLRRDS